MTSPVDPIETTHAEGEHAVSLTHDAPDRYTPPPTWSAYEPDIEKVLISTEEIQAKLAEMGERITEGLRGQVAAARRASSRARSS